MNELERVFKEDVTEPLIITASLKELLEKLKKVGTVESEKLYSDTVKEYTKVDTSNWDLEVDENGLNNFIKELEKTKAELRYNKQFILIDKENNVRQFRKLYTITPVISTRFPRMIEGFSRKSGYVEVSLEDILKYIKSDGEPFIGNLSYLIKWESKRQSKF